MAAPQTTVLYTSGHNRRKGLAEGAHFQKKRDLPRTKRDVACNVCSVSCAECRVHALCRACSAPQPKAQRVDCRVHSVQCALCTMHRVCSAECAECTIQSEQLVWRVLSTQCSDCVVYRACTAQPMPTPKARARDHLKCNSVCREGAWVHKTQLYVLLTAAQQCFT